MPNVKHRRKLFFFYAEADKNIAKQVFRRQFGLADSEIATPDDLRPGAFKSDEFMSLVESSEYTLLLITPALFAEDWAKYVEILAKNAAIEGSAEILTADLIHVPRKPLDLRSRVSLDFTAPANWPDAFARLRRHLQTTLDVSDAVPLCPYPGMLAYPADSKDRRLFFHGRDRETKEMLRRLREPGRLFVIGPSGSGKSSLIQAGVIPGLKSSSLHSRRTWHIVRSRPGQEPLVSLDALIKQVETMLSGLDSEQPEANRILVVIDQFEEVFVGQSPSIAKDYVYRVQRWANVPLAKLLFVVRADFLPELMESDLWPIAGPERIEVAPLRGEALRTAIIAPAEAQGVAIDAALVQRLVSDAADEPGALPLLQEAMVRLWDSIELHYLSLSAYQDLTQTAESGLAQVLSDGADRVFGQLSTREQPIARRILLSLVQAGSGRSDTRRQRNLDELRSVDDDPELFEGTVSKLIANRLLTADFDSRSLLRKVDLAHEALIRAWQTLKNWMDQYREVKALQERLLDKAHEWATRGRRGGLLDVYQLAEAEHWLNDPLSRDLGQSELIASYIAESRLTIDRAEKLEQERLRAVAQEAERRAEAERLRAVGERQLRLRSIALYLAARVQRDIEDRDLAALLARQSFLFDEQVGGAAEGAVYQALSISVEQPDTRVRLRRDGRGITEVSLSRDGALMASVDVEGVLRLWDLRILHPSVLRDLHETQGAIVHRLGSRDVSLQFSADGRTLGVLVAPEGLWSFEITPGTTKTRLKEVRGGFPRQHQSQSFGRAVSSRLAYDDAAGDFIIDGNEFVAASARRIIEARALDIPLYVTFRGSSPLPYQVAASRNGKMLLVGSSYPGSQTITLWKLDTSEPWRQELRTGMLGEANFSDDGDRLIFSTDTVIEHWNTGWPPERMLTQSRGGLVWSPFAISGDGITTAIGHSDGYISILREKPDSVTRLCFATRSGLGGSCFHGEERRLAVWTQDTGGWLYHTESNGSAIELRDYPGWCNEPRVETLKKLAYEIWKDRHRWPDIDKENWKNAEQTWQMRSRWQQISDSSGQVSKIVKNDRGEYAVAIWSKDQDWAPRLIHLSSSLKGATPHALGRLAHGTLALACAKEPDSGGQYLQIFGIGMDDEIALRYETSPLRGYPLKWMAFSPGGQFLLFQFRYHEDMFKHDGNIHTWKFRKETTSLPVTPPPEAVLCMAVAFSNDDDRFALAFSRRTRPFIRQKVSSFISEYSVNNPGSRSAIVNVDRLVTALAFSPNNNILAIGSIDGRLDLLYLQASRPEFARAGEFGSMIRDLHFDSRNDLLSIDDSGLVRSTITDNTFLASVISDRVSRNLSYQEWSTLVGEDIPYQVTCSEHDPPTDLPRPSRLSQRKPVQEGT